MSDLRRHDLREDVWLRLKPHLPGSKGNRGCRGKNNRLFLNALLWKLRTGTPWAATCRLNSACGRASATAFIGGAISASLQSSLPLSPTSPTSNG